MAPRHPLAQRETVSFQEATAYPVALQSKALTIRYLEAQYNWLFKEPRRFTETNSLQLVKQLALGGTHVLFTSELDVAPELASRQLVFTIPVRDKGAEPQEISVAMDATKPPGAIVKLVSERLIAAVQDALAAARAGVGCRLSTRTLFL